METETIGSTIRFPVELWKRAKIVAVHMDCAASDLVIAALEQHVTKLEAKLSRA